MTDKDNILSLNIASRSEEEYLKPVQSANTLFRFFKSPEHLYSSLKKGALVPRYYLEDVAYLDIGYKQIAYPMICFCDIAVHRLKDHVSFYGEYGIGFSKSWGIDKGIQPLQYINPNSILRTDFTSAFKYVIDNDNENPAANNLLTQMYFMKPIEGTMPRGSDTVSRNFTDECEWRFIPDLREAELPQIVPEDESYAIKRLNDTIEDHENCWLKYSHSDVKYIVISRSEDFDKLCSVLDENVSDNVLKRRLISKVIIWNEAKEDF